MSSRKWVENMQDRNRRCCKAKHEGENSRRALAIWLFFNGPIFFAEKPLLLPNANKRFFIKTYFSVREKWSLSKFRVTVRK